MAWIALAMAIVWKSSIFYPDFGGQATARSWCCTAPLKKRAQAAALPPTQQGKIPPPVQLLAQETLCVPLETKA